MNLSHPRCPFVGSYVALPTLFRGGEVDHGSLRSLVEWHIEQGTDGFVACGTTGEAATLTDAERQGVIEAIVGWVRGRRPVLAGVGTNDTRTTVANARAATAGGANGLLVVTPYYNKPSPRGLVAHYSAVAQLSATPIVLYNVPSRTGVDMIPEVVGELAREFEHVVAVKEAKVDLERVKRLVRETPAAVLCGDDASIADFMALGAVGVIGVLNNVLPREVAELVRCAGPGGDSVRAAALVEQLAPLARDLFIEPNPVPVKAALARMFLRITDQVRLPLVGLEESSQKTLLASMRASGLQV